MRAPGEENLDKPPAQSEDPWPQALDPLTSCPPELSVEAAKLPSLPLVFSMRWPSPRFSGSAPGNPGPEHQLGTHGLQRGTSEPDTVVGE